MKIKTLIMTSLYVSGLTYAQVGDIGSSSTQRSSQTVGTPFVGDGKDSPDATYGGNKRISFFVGAGTSIISNDVYELPVINKTTNNVIIEQSGRLKPNVSMGIVYSPYVYDVIRTVTYVDSNNVQKTKTIIEHVPKSFSVALFINPISFNANSNLGNTIDLGLGLGWRSDNFAVFATMEFFSLKQPRQYFVDEYGQNNKQYYVGGAVQSSIDLNDSSIFKNQIMTAFGLKLSYTFDVVSRYNASSTD